MRLDAAVICHVGKVRQNNEDNFYLQGSLRQMLEESVVSAQWQGEASRCLFAVADGMGGEENGEVASLVTVQSLRPCVLGQVQQTAEQSIAFANELLCDEMRQKKGRRMGSTLAALYVDEGKAVSCNVGDSRVYLLRNGNLQQLSKDHTRVRQMVEMGIITPEEARTHKSRHMITQNIGIFPEEMIIQPDFTEPVTLQRGDRFLLCSDGLTDMLTDQEISAILKRDQNVSELAAGLTEEALAKGGKDNVTVLVIEAEEKKKGIAGFFQRGF